MNDLKSMFVEDKNEISQKIEEEIRLNSRKHGINLDLMKLTGGLSSIIPSSKEKKDENSRQKWVWSPFNNPARQDKVQFYHWQKVEHVKDIYEYSKLNTRINIVNITKDEYHAFCDELDPSWTWEETKYLWELCHDFDLRFIVIHDRYNYADRTIEELKDRYYSVCRKLLEARRQFDHPILKSGYSFENEVKRRACLERIINKNTDMLQTEKELLGQAAEVKEKIEKIMRFEKLEQKVLNQVTDEGEIGECTFEEYMKKRPVTENSFAYLRSYKMAHPIPINEKVQKKVDLMLKELNIPENPMPTERVENLYDKIKNNLIILTSLKKHLEKKDKEKKNLETSLETYTKHLVRNNTNNQQHKINYINNNNVNNGSNNMSSSMNNSVANNNISNINIGNTNINSISGNTGNIKNDGTNNMIIPGHGNNNNLGNNINIANTASHNVNNLNNAGPNSMNMGLKVMNNNNISNANINNALYNNNMLGINNSNVNANNSNNNTTTKAKKKHKDKEDKPRKSKKHENNSIINNTESRDISLIEGNQNNNLIANIPQINSKNNKESKRKKKNINNLNSTEPKEETLNNESILSQKPEFLNKKRKNTKDNNNAETLESSSKKKNKASGTKKKSKNFNNGNPNITEN